MLKKLNKGLAILGTVGVLALGVAFAQNDTAPQSDSVGPGYGQRPHHYGPHHYGPRGSKCSSQIDPQKAKEFCNKIQPQWQKMWEIKKELRELWSKNPPDWEAIEKKEMELEKLRLEIRKKAYEEGISCGPGKGLGLKRLCGW